MKRILLVLASFSLLLTSCSLDNYPGPNAKVHGSFLDSANGSLVGTDITNGNQILVFEQGYSSNPDIKVEEASSSQTWKIKNTGEYRNDLVFAGKYRVLFQNGNFYGSSDQVITLNEGDNEINFTVTPYLRIKDCSIAKSGNTVTAKFKIEGGKPGTKINEIRLFGFSDMWVGNYIKYDVEGGTDRISGLKEEANGSKEYTLTIDLDKNKSYFKYTGKNYYFRVGATAVADNSLGITGTIRHNYSELVKIAF